MNIMNRETLERLECLKNSEPRSIVLWGDRGLGKYQAARELAAAWLNVEPDALETQPDFLLIEPEDGSIRSEKSDLIRRKAMFCPDVKAIVLVNGAEGMTGELQNKILKVLEDCADRLAVLFVTSEELLDTVMSRCITVYFQPVGFDRLLKEYKPVKTPILLASNGCPGTYESLIEDAEFSMYLEEFFKSFTSIREKEDLRQLLALTHALKEKDREYLPEVLAPWQMEAFLHMLEHLFWCVVMEKNGLTGYEWVKAGGLPSCYTAEEAETAYYAIIRAWKASRRKGAFTKNDFFGLLIAMIPLGK